MKYLVLIIALCALFAAAGCPQRPKGTAESVNTHSGAQVTPPQPGSAANPPEGTTPPGAGGSGETDKRLELGDIYIGMEYGMVRAKFPVGWQQSPQWAKGAEELTGVVNFTGPMSEPEKGVVTPPEVMTYAFLDGKLVAMLRAVPKVTQADVETYRTEMDGKYCAHATQTPPFAESCDFLLPLRKPAPGDTVAVWSASASRQLLGVQYSGMVSLATYYLADTEAYTKVTRIMMDSTAPPVATPPADPPATK